MSDSEDDSQYGWANISQHLNSTDKDVNFYVKLTVDTSDYTSDQDDNVYEETEYRCHILTLHKGQPAVWDLKGCTEAHDLLSGIKLETAIKPMSTELSHGRNPVNDTTINRLCFMDTNIVGVMEWLNGHDAYFVSDIEDDDSHYDLPALEDTIGHSRLFFNQDRPVETVVSQAAAAINSPPDKLAVHFYANWEERSHQLALFAI